MEIIEYLKNKYHPDCIIVYGSYADNSQSEHSDFDALVIADCQESIHDTSTVNNVRLDVFVHPAAYFKDSFDREEFVQILGGIVVLDKNDLAADILKDIQNYVANKPSKTKDEIKSELTWCRKMLLRASRTDTEGLFRMHWLLTDSLEIFCDATHTLYSGPKKSLKWMEKHYPDAYACYSQALSECSLSAIEKWIELIEKTSEEY